MTEADLQNFRNMAETSRGTAATMSDPQIKAALQRVAAEFEGIADRIGDLLKLQSH